MGTLRINIDRQEFTRLYLTTDISIKELCKFYKVDPSTIHTRIKVWNLHRTTEHDNKCKLAGRKRTNIQNHNQPVWNNRQKAKQTCIERYGVSNPHQLDTTIQKTRQTKLSRYDNENYNNMAKNRQTCIERYGVDSVFKLPDVKYKIKCTMLKRYGVDNGFKITQLKPYFKIKEYETRKKNGTLNTSKLETNLYNILLNHFVFVSRQYKIGNMWFDIKINNTLIELNGLYYHNYRPFNNTKQDLLEYESLVNKR